jgi:hypothetical protein
VQTVGAYVSPSVRLLRFLSLGVTGAYGTGSTNEVAAPAFSTNRTNRWRLTADARIYPLHIRVLDPWVGLEVGMGWIHRDQTVQGTSSIVQPVATETQSTANGLVFGGAIGADLYALPWLTVGAALHLQTEPPMDPTSTASLFPIMLFQFGLGLHLPLGG